MYMKHWHCGDEANEDISCNKKRKDKGQLNIYLKKTKTKHKSNISVEYFHQGQHN